MDGDVKGIRECVKMGADGNTPHNGGITHMHVSAHGGHVGAIKILVELGANVNTPNSSGAIPTFFAAQEGRADALRALVRLGDYRHLVIIGSKPRFFLGLGWHMWPQGWDWAQSRHSQW